MVLLKAAGGYIEPSKILTFAPKRLKYGLKWSTQDTLDDPWCPQTIFFQKLGVGPSKLLFFIPARDFWKTHFWRITTIWGALQQILGKKLSEDILDHEEYPLGIIISHIWAFLEHYYGFWKVFYTGPSLLKDPFLVDNDTLEGSTPNFWKKIVWGHPGSWRVSSWDHFKPYLGLFGALVWILEGFLYPPVTFRSTIFER